MKKLYLSRTISRYEEFLLVDSSEGMSHKKLESSNEPFFVSQNFLTYKKNYLVILNCSKNFMGIPFLQSQWI